MLLTDSILFKISKSNLPYGKEPITISLCVLSTGSLLNKSYLVSLMCNTSLTNLHIALWIREAKHKCRFVFSMINFKIKFSF